MARRIEVDIVGDSSSLERAFRRSSAAASKFNRDISRTKQVAGGFGVSAQLLSAAGIGAAIKSTVSAASDLNEQIGKTDVVFGKSAEQVKAWSETTTEAFGVSQREALATASTFGALLRPIGLTGKAAADQSEKLTQLGADLASFYNTSVADALDAVRSGIVGEAEPLRRYGVLLSETRVQQEALRETGKRHATQLTDQEKVLARIAIIYRDSAKAQGDFARSQGRLAGQTKELSANVDDLAANIGGLLTPAVTFATAAFNSWFDVLKKAPDVVAAPKVESVFVKSMAKQLEGFKKSGHPLAPVLTEFRQQMADAGFGPDEANKLIAEAFTFSRDPKLRARLAQQAKDTVKDAAKATDKAVKGEANRRAQQRNTWFDAMIGRQLDRVQDLPLRKQLVRLRDIAGEIKTNLGDTKDVTRRLTLQDQLVQIARQEKTVQGQITDEKTKQLQAVKDQIDAQQRLADQIKSATIDQLQRQQTGRENQRAIADATEQLRIARRIGGPHGIQLAARALADAKFAQGIFGLQATPATLRGGQFGLGAIHITINGVTDPDEVAKKVVAAIERRRRHTTITSRGPAAGTAGANR